MIFFAKVHGGGGLLVFSTLGMQFILSMVVVDEILPISSFGDNAAHPLS